MKHKILTSLLILTATFSKAQDEVIVNLNPTFSNVKMTGFNLNNQTKPTWSNQSFLDSLQSLHVEFLRYPGGTISQYWDWQNGRALPASAWGIGGYQNYQYIGTTTMVPDFLSDYKSALDSLDAKPLFVLNVLSRDVRDQINMLRAARDIGINVEYIELGNEMYFVETDFINRFPTAGTYAREMNIWRDSILTNFPNAKIAIIGATTQPLTPNGLPTPDRIRFWNDSIYANYQPVEYITFHNYYNHKTPGLNPNANNVIANAFNEHQLFKSYSSNTLPAGIKVWFTEYNLNDNTQGAHTVASSWLHGLFTGVLFLKHFEDPRIEMLINHQITGSAPFASLNSYSSGDTLSNNLTAEGNVMKWLNKASKNHISSTSLDFSLNPTINANSLSFPSFLGRYFIDSIGNKSIVVFNLSDNSYELDLSNIFSTQTNKEVVIISSSNINQLNLTTQNLIINTSYLTNTPISIPPKSFIYLRENNENISNTSEDNYFINQLKIYPNPTNSFISLEFSDEIKLEEILIEVHNLQGSLLKTFVPKGNNQNYDLSKFPNGTYLVTVRQNGKILTKKVIKN